MRDNHIFENNKFEYEINNNRRQFIFRFYLFFTVIILTSLSLAFQFTMDTDLIIVKIFECTSWLLFLISAVYGLSFVKKHGAGPRNAGAYLCVCPPVFAHHRADSGGGPHCNI